MGPTHFALATQLQGLTHFAPADMTGQDSEVQNSVIVPYSMLIWLKKSTAAGKEEEDNKQVVRSAAKGGSTLAGYRHICVYASLQEGTHTCVPSCKHCANVIRIL